MIEKTYGRPAIADIVGYTSLPDHPQETIMQARIEGTIVEIPIDAVRTGYILENNPPGSQVSVCFYNCEWHIEGRAVSSRNASPRIGISISELLRNRDVSTLEQDRVPEIKRASNPEITREKDIQVAQVPEINLVNDPEIMPEEDFQAAQDYINEIQVEFRVEAQELLKSIDLSHLKAGTS